MRAFLEKCGKEWLDDFVYISNNPLRDLGVEVIPFDGTFLDDFIDKYSFNKNNDILIGSVEATTEFFKACNVDVPQYLGYPKELTKYLDRYYEITTFGQLENEKFPYFVKPFRDVKLFTGSVVESKNQLNILKNFMGKDIVPDETEVYLFEPVEFISEYRCFVHKGELKGIKHYLGDFKIFPNTNVVENIIRDFENAPVSYTIDVGITEDHSTVLVEINDFWAIGSYGFNGRDYVRMSIDRFREISK